MPLCAEDGEGLTGVGDTASGLYHPAAVRGIGAPRAHCSSQPETQLLWQSPATQRLLLEGGNMQNVIGSEGSLFYQHLPPGMALSTLDSSASLS